MALILSIETSTTNCSVSLSNKGKVCALIEHNDVNYSHSENLHKFIKEALSNASFLIEDLDAVAVSMGPGSYTGLRIGVSAAKGLCFSLGIPLIAIPTLEIIARQLHTVQGNIVSLLDARRMEVYAAVYDSEYTELRKTKAEIIDEGSFSEYLEAGDTYFIGPGAEKCKGVITHENAVFSEDIVFPSAREMAMAACIKYRAGDFEDVAYFEPYYLKDFIAGIKKQ